jgi:endonuclease III
MSEKRIRDILVGQGQRLFDARKTFVNFTKNMDADKLLNDLDHYPHAFVLGCVMDRQVKAELAWLIPHRFSQKLGDFRFSTLVNLSLEQIQDLMTHPVSLHRFPEKMSVYFYQAVQTIDKVYGGDAAKIWADNPSSAEVVYQFLQFDGVGPKIATMAANILARDFKIPFRDYYSIDISPDIHIRRVFTRLALVPKNPSNEHLVYKARALSPEFPGLMDLPSWEIGRQWCRPKEPACRNCYMNQVCPTAKSGN